MATGHDDRQSNILQDEIPMTDDTSAQSPRPQNAIPPIEALKRLMEGNTRYVAGTTTPINLSAERAAAVVEHAPIAAILGCADARVAAELIFDQGPGDLFMVRVAGNFLSDYGLASIEYAVEFLDVPLVMVLGHTMCGAVTSAVRVVEEGIALPGRLPVLIDAIEPAVYAARMGNPENLLDAAIVENARRQMNRLSMISPIINEAVAAGKVMVVGGIYDIATGEVTLV
ncbi:MAG TPA: carbonic anhydrase [Thermomicrobiales bacterium]|nr:carbonic anhydrase [Thermomicrobiales bacterium]